MKNLINILKKEIFPISLILILAFARLIPHPPNFTPILAVGIFAGFYFKNFILSFFIVVFSMFLGDLYLGFHNTMFFTYSALAIAVLVGYFVKKFKFTEIFLSGLISSLGFFVITNFGAWFTLKKDTNGNYIYRKNTRILSFVYAILVTLLLIATNGSR